MSGEIPGEECFFFKVQFMYVFCIHYGICMGNYCYRELWIPQLSSIHNPGHLLSIGGPCPVLKGWIINHQKNPGTWTNQNDWCCVNGRFWKFFHLACFIIFHFFGQHFKGVQLLFDLCTVFPWLSVMKSIPFGILTPTPPVPWPG